MADVLIMSEDVMNGASAGLGQCSTNIDNAGKGMGSKFSKLSSTGLFSQGLATITKQLGQLSSSCGNVQKIVTKHSAEMFDADKNMASIAEGIEIPQDFVKNDSTEYNEFRQMIIDKTGDGKSVNEGQANRDSYKVEINGQMKNLGDINNGIGTEGQVYDSSSSVNKNGAFQDINVAGGDQEQKLVDAFGTNKEGAFQNINGNGGTQEQSLNGNINVLKENLTDIANNGGLENVKTGDYVVNAQDLKSINTPTGVTQTVNSEGRKIDASELRSIVEERRAQYTNRSFDTASEFEQKMSQSQNAQGFNQYVENGTKNVSDFLKNNV